MHKPLDAKGHLSPTVRQSRLLLQTRNDNKNDIILNSSNQNSPDEETNKNKRSTISLSRSILQGLHKHSNNNSLNVETDFYDPTTGLHSEGVWHNSLVGIASIKLAQQEDDGCLLEAVHIADSLYKYSWDGVSFQRRAYSGLWNHDNIKDSKNDVHQANYYRSCKEHRCIQHGMALIFWSRLVQYFEKNKQEVFCQKYLQQYSEISKQFLKEYWSDSKNLWFTVGKSQGGGTLLRPSASWGKPTIGATSKKNYYRAIDHAVALLACCEMKRTKTNEELVDYVISKTCHQLLSGFGYETQDARSYIGLDRNRNLWHDGWVVLALLSSFGVYDWTRGNEKDLVELVKRLQAHYADKHTGLVWHWAPSHKPNIASGNVHYCGDNALWYAICHLLKDITSEAASPLLLNKQAFWEFVHDLQSPQQDDGGLLVRVADVYPQVRLHPNTELAALAIWSL